MSLPSQTAEAQETATPDPGLLRRLSGLKGGIGIYKEGSMIQRVRVTDVVLDGFGAAFYLEVLPAKGLAPCPLEHFRLHAKWNTFGVTDRAICVSYLNVTFVTRPDLVKEILRIARREAHDEEELMERISRLAYPPPRRPVAELPSEGQPARGRSLLNVFRNPVSRFLVGHLKVKFDHLLDESQDYVGRLCAECRDYPEWDLIPCVFPTLAYAALARRAGGASSEDTERMARLVTLAGHAARRRVKPPDDDLLQLADYSRHAVYLGLFNLAMSAFLLATGDRRFEAMNRHLSDLLGKALAESNGRPLWSYPTESWPFDTLSAVLSLRLWDAANGARDHEAVIGRHLEWLKGEGSDPSTGLPWSMVPMEDGTQAHVPPRGCALSVVVSLLWALDPNLSRRLYPRYVRNFWQFRRGLAGFREWPKGIERGADMDSGPVLWGFGLAANGFALASTQLHRDHGRSAILKIQILMTLLGMKAVKYWAWRFRSENPILLGGFPIRRNRFTGFLFGDACLFFALTLHHLWDGLAAVPVSQTEPPTP